MRRSSINLVIDLLAATLLIAMVATGYILFFTLPPETNKSLLLWSLTRHQWGQIHSWISLGLIFILILHLALHWEWIVVMVAQRLGLPRTSRSLPFRSGLVAILVLATALGLFVWVTEVSVRDAEGTCCKLNEYPEKNGGNVISDNLKEGIIAPSRIDFWKQVYPVFEHSCLGCHGPIRALGGFRVDRREEYFGTTGKVSLVVPGHSAESPLIAIVQGRRPEMAMADRHKLPEEQIAILRTWIDAGANWPEGNL